MPLETSVPPPELVGQEIGAVESRLGQPALFRHDDVAACNRRLEWAQGGIEWTVDVACPPVPHELGFRKSRVDEYRVFSVYHRPAEP